jgi:tryptophanyl-tRNA synthetase
LRNRVALQRTHPQFVLIADAQALTDNAGNPAKVARNVVEVALDYLAVVIDPARTTICVQSCIPALAELSQIYLNFVTVARLERNPTVKEEIRLRGFARDVPAGFLCYLVGQADDITAFGAGLVPVGDDQLPMIEQTNEIVRRVNHRSGRDVLAEARALVVATGRLPAIDGKGKMSKSQGNAIALNATREEISAAVRRMFTDPGHLRVSYPGRVEGNVAFAYLDAFDERTGEVEALKAAYRSGGLADHAIKARLEAVLQALLGPIRERRSRLAQDRDTIRDVLREGTKRARVVAARTLSEVKEALGLFLL